MKPPALLPAGEVEAAPHFKVTIRSLLAVFKALHTIQAASLQLPLRGGQRFFPAGDPRGRLVPTSLRSLLLILDEPPVVSLAPWHNQTHTNA